MTDQAKRWTAEGRCVLQGGTVVAGCDAWSEGDDFDCATASRLAACADLLRGVGDLEGVVVMTWADVEKVREALEWFRGKALREGSLYSESKAGDGLHFLPVPPKGDGHVA